jgi:hypothetical protein
MEDTKIPLSKWLFAMHLLGASKKGVSALQLSRMLGVTYGVVSVPSHSRSDDA